jgi:hypothetical protein
LHYHFVKWCFSVLRNFTTVLTTQQKNPAKMRPFFTAAVALLFLASCALTLADPAGGGALDHRLFSVGQLCLA